MKYLLMMLTMLCSGCVVYPINKTLQPKAEILVLGHEGVPLDNARVYLITNSYPYGSEKRRVRSETNSNGKVYLPKIKKWRTQALMLHGAEIFFWNWCIEKKGYETHVTNWRNSKEFPKKYKVTLSKGVTFPCPEEFF